jgi:hypothetical protein
MLCADFSSGGIYCTVPLSSSLARIIKFSSLVQESKRVWTWNASKYSKVNAFRTVDDQVFGGKSCIRRFFLRSDDHLSINKVYFSPPTYNSVCKSKVGGVFP